MYHVLVPVSFHQRHSQGRDNPPFDVQDCCFLSVLGVQFHTIHAINYNL